MPASEPIFLDLCEARRILCGVNLKRTLTQLCRDGMIEDFQLLGDRLVVWPSARRFDLASVFSELTTRVEDGRKRVAK